MFYIIEDDGLKIKEIKSLYNFNYFNGLPLLDILLELALIFKNNKDYNDLKQIYILIILQLAYNDEIEQSKNEFIKSSLYHNEYLLLTTKSLLKLEEMLCVLIFDKDIDNDKLLNLLTNLNN